MDKIGMYKGKNISDMTREELLDFAKWCAGRIQTLERIESETQDFRLNKEIRFLKPI